MSKFKIFGEDILKSADDELEHIYKADGLEYALSFLMSIVRSETNLGPNPYRKEFLKALLKLPIVKKILRENFQNLVELEKVALAERKV